MHPRDYRPMPQMGNHHPASNLAVDAVESMDITDSRERSPTRSLPKMRDPSPDSDHSDDSNLTMKIPGKDRIMNDRASLAAKIALKNAQRLSRQLNNHSAQESMTTSSSRSRYSSPDPSTGTPLDLDNIPMRKLKRRKHFSIDDTDEDEGDEGGRSVSPQWSSSAFKATRNYMHGSTPPEDPHELRRVKAHDPPLPSGQVTPIHERNSDCYIPKPRAWREGFLSALLGLNHEQEVRPSIATIPGGLAAVVARANERLSFAGSANEESPSWHNSAFSPLSSGVSTPTLKRGKRRPTLRSRSTGALDKLAQPFRKKIEERSIRNQSIRIQVHIAETLSRQRYLVKLCQALMTYGAPTHRMEEYMRMSARVLEIQSQFFYFPTCMVIAFDDDATHTSEIKLVRAPQGIDLSRLKDTHEIYKEVLRDEIGVDEAIPRLDEVMKREPRYGRSVLILMYGLSSASVAPFAFKARLIDLPIAFVLGICVGICQLMIVPLSDLYSNVSEVSIAVFTSFLSRALGSIRNGPHFCFSALAQSSIVLILPGYTLLCGSLELQSKSYVAGSVRIVYALIYSLFLGFGITIGTALYGYADENATSKTICDNPMTEGISWIFVPIFTGSLIIINQGRITQMVVMILLSFTGYIVNHYAGVAFGNAQVSQAVGALAIGVLANLYSRVWEGLAVAAVLPAVFVQVPSGLAATGSLISGMVNADEITGNGGSSAVTGNGTMGTMQVVGNEMIFTVGYNMIQVAIGITGGLFLSSLVVYPRGKRRSGLFSF